MKMDTGIIKVIEIDSDGNRAAQIECSKSILPSPGKYFQAYNPDEPDDVLGVAIFPVGVPGSLDDSKTPSLGPIPPGWRPGTRLNLCGPLGKGFSIPEGVSRLALAAFGDTAARLLPLIRPAIHYGADIAIFTPDPLHQPGILPNAVEVHPLSALPAALSWAACLIIEIPLEDLPHLRDTLELGPHNQIPCPSQALIWTPMPCSGLGDCGVCAVQTHKKGYQLTCKDGPVFNLADLVW
jgi:hypothetical protein